MFFWCYDLNTNKVYNLDEDEALWRAEHSDYHIVFVAELVT